MKDISDNTMTGSRDINISFRLRWYHEARRLTLLVACTLLAVVVATPSLAQSKQDLVDSADRFFAGIKAAKKTAPQATLETWVQIQERLRDLQEIATTSSDSTIAWEARYVAAYGFWMIELFDVAAAMDSTLATRAITPTQRTRAFRDLAQALENAASFGASAEASARLIASMDKPRFLELNNHALRLLKAGHYDAAREYVKRIELNEESAHTRIFSARAFAYQGKYDEALAELKVACEHNEDAACRIIESIGTATSAEAFWSDERTRRVAAWQPYNRVDSSISLGVVGASSLLGAGNSVSDFAPSYWFNAVHGLYPAPGDKAVVPTLPTSLKRGRVGAIVLEGVPFIAVLFDSTLSVADARAAAALYASQVGASSEAAPKGAMRTRSLFAPTPESTRVAFAIFTHSTWQEKWVRRVIRESQFEQ